AAPSNVNAWTIGPNNIGVYWDAEHNPGGLSHGAWSNGTGLPEAVYGHAAAVAGDLLFITGGYDGVAYKSAVWYAPLSAEGAVGAWTQTRSLPAARYAHSAAALRGRLYVIGGYNGSPRAEVWSAPISSSGALGEWVEEIPLPQGVYAHASAVGNGTFYVIGGYDSAARNEVLYAGVNSTGTLSGWTAGPSLSQASYLAAAGIGVSTSGPRLYVTGGYDGSSAKTDVWSSPMDASGTPTGWTAEPPLPSGVYAHALAAAPNALFISGGNGGTLARAATLRAPLNGDGSIAGWESGADLDAARQAHVMLARGSRLLVLGGYDGSSAKLNSYYSEIGGTEFRLSVAGAPFTETPWLAAGALDVGGLVPNSYYTFTPSARNSANAEAPASVSFSTVTLAAQPSTAAIAGVFISSVQVSWLVNDNHAATLYEAQLSSDAAHTLPAGSSVTIKSYAVIGGLDNNATYYARVRALNDAGLATAWTQLGSTVTRTDPTLDHSSPTIHDNQAGDDAWRGANTGLYDMDFEDDGGAYLARFEIRATTAADGSGTPSPDWSGVVSGINSNSYTADWSLDTGHWSLLRSGTNYISLRVWDGNDNSSTTVSAFYILKDTSPPVITDLQADETFWRSSNTAVYNVDFEDALSGLSAIEYSASPNQGSGDASALSWRPIAALTPGTSYYNAPWAVDFAALANDATNYISVRAWDLAGTTETVTGVDMFKILKYVSGPEVFISTPASSYLTSLVEIAGTVSDARSHTAQGSELSIKDAAAARYWDGSAFTSVSPQWLTVSGVQEWSYTPGIDWAEGASYQLVARSSDTEGNYSLVYATRSFALDTAAPSAVSTVPANGATVNSLPIISGTAYDAVSGVAALALKLGRLSDGKWWDFTADTWTVSGSSAP
ncbi:MAG: hypothetical protein COT18_11055, partial [Elusimicrobia bacterium CG08_land_8_20_14_0_20_59_10]